MYPRLVGGTLYNIFLQYKKAIDEEDRNITETKFLAGILNVLGNNINIDALSKRELNNFGNKLQDLKSCEKNAFEKGYLNKDKLRKITGTAFSSSCLKLRDFFPRFIDDGAITDIVAALKEIIEDDPEISEDESFSQSVDGGRVITKRKLREETRINFVPFILAAMIYAFQQENRDGVTTLEKWGDKSDSSVKLDKLGEKYRKKLIDTPLLEVEKTGHGVSNANELQYELVEHDYEALEKQVALNPGLCVLWNEIRRGKKLFVETEAYKGAYRTILKKGCALLAGNPGTGKSMTSEMVALKMAGRGYTIHYLYGIKDGLSKLYDEITRDENENRKDFILLDDCMGQASFELNSIEENELNCLVNYVWCHKDVKTILLNSRIRIINELSTHGIVRNIYEEMEADKCVINVESLTRIEKALMLRNHIFNRLDEEHYNDVKYYGCFRIIDHDPYIPRVIDHITKEKNAVKIKSKGDFLNDIIRALDNPTAVWSEIYDNEKATPLEARVLLKALFSLTNSSCELEKCRDAFFEYLKLEHPVKSPNRPWDTALSVLNESMIKRTNNKGHDMIGFLDHSVHDFLDKNVYPSFSPQRKNLEVGAIYVEQIEKIGGFDSYKLKIQLGEEGKLERLIYSDLQGKEDDIFKCVAFSGCCRESYIPIVHNVFESLEKQYRELYFYTRSGYKYAGPAMLMSLMKSEGMRDFYLSGNISRRIFDLCTRTIEIADAVSFLIDYPSYLSSFDFDLDESSVNSLIRESIENTRDDLDLFISDIEAPHYESEIDSAVDEMNQLVCSYFDDILNENEGRLGKYYEMFKKAIEEIMPEDYTDAIKANFTIEDEDEEDEEDDYRTPSNSSIYNSPSDTEEILKIFSVPFFSTKS